MYTSDNGLSYEIEPYAFGVSEIDVSELQMLSTSASMLALSDEKLASGKYWAVAHIGKQAIGIAGVTYIWEGRYAEKGGSYVLNEYRRHGIGYNLGCFVTKQIEDMGLIPMTLSNDLSAGLNQKIGFKHVPHDSLPMAVYEECTGCPTEKPLGAICCHEAYVKLD